MPALHSDAFDVIPFEDIKGDWKKLGAGSFGNVYKGNYLGIDVAIKEVLPSNDYDVAKYFEREWRLMKETRHPNVVLYLGLSKAPDPDGRIFIISEFIDNGNLRNYIHDKTKPFPWRLRISFATDIARALAYLHARRCIHRDLKGENLLVTANGRLKITDFGFARIAARNADEQRRLTFCGTDSYMSPEILRGDEFDLPTDVFSLGVIFTEIAARRLADDRHFKRAAPYFTIDEREVREAASQGCPPAFVQLALDCMNPDAAQRPTTREILDRLNAIEVEVLAQSSEADAHVGSVKFMTGTKRPGAAPRIPSFGMGVGKDIRSNGDKGAFSSDEDSEDELAQAIEGLKAVNISGGATAGHESQQPLIDSTTSEISDYRTTVIRGQSTNAPSTIPPALSSILTIRPSPTPGTEHAFQALPSEGATAGHSAEPTASMLTLDSYRTATSSFAPSVAAATQGGSHLAVSPSTLMHRFTLIKPGARKTSVSHSRSASPPGTSPAQPMPAAVTEGWSPFDFFFSSGMAKCDLCTRRIGWKPSLECDDCGLRAHLKCGELAPRDCGIRPPRHVHTASTPPLQKAKDKGKK